MLLWLSVRLNNANGYVLFFNLSILFLISPAAVGSNAKTSCASAYTPFSRLEPIIMILFDSCLLARKLASQIRLEKTQGSKKTA